VRIDSTWLDHSDRPQGLFRLQPKHQWWLSVDSIESQRDSFGNLRLDVIGAGGFPAAMLLLA
jgi:hypothetical protein